MKLLHVVPSFGLGGMEKVLCSVINGLPASCEQGIISLTGELGAMKWIQGNKIVGLPFERPQGNTEYFKALREALRQWAPEVLMTYNWGATDAIWLGRSCGIPHIIHSEHGFNVDEAASTQWKRDLIRFLVYRFATRLIVVSRDLERMMNDTFRIPRNRVDFIPNGIDTDFYHPNVYEREKVRDALTLHPQDMVIGFAGRLDPVKNFPFMLQVVSHCVRMDKRLKLVLIGDGPEKENILNCCSEYGIRDHVVLVGKHENVLPYLQALDVFMLTSFGEQMPISMLEAMSVGVPIVASAVGEIPAILNGQGAGFVHDIREGHENFVDAIRTFRDPNVRIQMGKNARNLVVKQFQERLMIQGYTDLLQTITGKNLLSPVA